MESQYLNKVHSYKGFTGGARDKKLTCQCRKCKRLGLDTWVGKIPWRRAWQPTPVFLHGEPHGQRSLAGYALDAKNWARLK